MQGTPETRLHWGDVELFLALMRERALGPAAKLLSVDASTVSRKLAGLEEALGLALFDRSREGLSPTAYAERLLPEAEAMEASANRFAHEAVSFEREVEGRVCLSAPPGLVDAFIVPLLPALIARFPRLTIEIDSRVQVVDLSRREADLALRTVPPQGADLIQKRIFESRSVLMASPEYARELGTVKSLDKVRVLQWGPDLAHLPHARWFRKHATGARVALITSSMPSQVIACERGVGVGLFPLPYLSAQRLVAVRAGRALTEAMRELPLDEVWLVSHRALRRVPRVDAVWNFIDEQFQATPGRVQTRP